MDSSSCGTSFCSIQDRSIEVLVANVQSQAPFQMLSMSGIILTPRMHIKVEEALLDDPPTSMPLVIMVAKDKLKGVGKMPNKTGGAVLLTVLYLYQEGPTLLHEK